MSTSSYGQILKSSSIVGGAQAINYVVALLRTKAVALLLGPSGVGLVGLYVSAIGLVGTFAQFGINESGVREVAAAAGTNNAERIAATAKTLRRVCWASGILGWVLTAALAWPLAKWTFGSPEHAWAIAILGSAVLLDLVAGGQRALLQGVRKIGDLARMQIASAIIATVLSVSVYWWLGHDGILPVIILTSFVQLGTSWWFSRRIELAPVQQTWSETWLNSVALFRLGSAFMYGALLAGAVGLAIRALIVRDLGIEAAGIYQAAWALSGMFGAFVLQAMGTDFYPRLTAVAETNTEISRLVKEQVETGILLCLPVILAAIASAPVLIELFYSSKFSAAVVPLKIFAIGVLGQTISWPIGMVLSAKGSTLWIYLTRTHGAVLHVALSFLLLPAFGMQGIAWAFAIYIWLQCIVVFVVVRKYSGLELSFQVVALALASLFVCLAALAVSLCLAQPAGSALALLLSLVAGIWCLRRLAARVGSGGRLGRLLQRFASIGR